jgi:TonB-linked SusC/RagA family outer membrane protein
MKPKLNKHIFLLALLMSFCMISVTLAQSRTITGTVVSATTEEPLPGATIMVKGTTSGTVTDLDGKYVLVVPIDKEILIFTYLGYKMREEKILNRPVVNIKLEEDILGLETVVVTALGIPKEKLSLGVSTQEVTGAKIASSGEENFIEGLSAKAAGVQVVGAAGTPGASSKIIIRGPSTFSNENQPLIIVDGVPVDNNTNGTVAGDNPFNANLAGVSNSNRAIDINPDDIESVNILKGPAAAALYGSRASSGAIIITTKRGNQKGDDAVHVQFSSTLEINQVSKLPAQQNKYAQGTGGGNLTNNGTLIVEGDYETADPGLDYLWDTDDMGEYNGTPESWGPPMENAGLTPVDNLGDFFQSGLTYNNNISISGGSDKGSMRFSIGSTKDNGVIPNTNYNRTSIRINSDLQVWNKFKITADANYIRSGGNRVQNGNNLSGVMLGLLRAPTSYNLSAGYEYPSGANRNYFANYDNPYWTIYNNPFTDQVNRFIGNFGAIYTPYDWATITYRLGTDSYSDERKQIFAIGSNDPDNAPGGQIEENLIRYNQVYSDLIISGSKNVNESITINYTLGNNITILDDNYLYSRGRDLTIPDYYNIGNASDLYSSQQTTQQRNAAFFGEIGFDFQSFLFINLTGRNEWSSTYGANEGAAFFPSMNTSFVFSELMNTNNIWSFGKIRAAIAQVGIEPQPYSSNTYFVSPLFTDGFTGGYGFPFLGLPGFGHSQSNILGNPELSPERLTAAEVGIELKFWRGRIDLEAVVYQQVSSELLLVKPIAATSGFSYVYDNVGEMKNQGIEITLNADIIRKKDFTWNVGGNFSKNENEVTQLAGGVDEIELEVGFDDPAAYLIVGQPYAVLYGSKWQRSPDGDILINENTGLPLLDTINGIIGDPNPDWLMNINTLFTWKNIGVSALFDIRKGGDIWCGTVARMNAIGISEASAARDTVYVIDGVVEVANGVYAENTTAIGPDQYFDNYLGDAGASEQQIFDGSWVRLREVKLTYDFELDKRNVVKGLSLSATGRNLWLHTKYPGVDPETSLTGAGSNISGFDWFNNPGTKSYLFTLTASF